MKLDDHVKDNNCLHCTPRNIPVWLVLLDNVPTLFLFIIGSLIIFRVTPIGSVVFLLYSFFSVFYFWAKICPYCPHFDTLACPCGYGIISSKLFKRKTDKSFKKVFKRNIGIVFPNWFIPLAVIVYLILTDYSKGVLVLSVLFCVTGFILIPLISKLVGCKNCAIRNDCPWMN
ncbi:MAG: hypothetical protein HC905_21220 [Bacteroidales bacterium]|nr:hypothetical protein [Bacteroidales bacterium]